MKPLARAAIAGAVLVALACAALLIRREVQTGRAAVRAAESNRLAQDFAEVGQCFFGEQPKSEDITFRKLANISGHLDGTGSNWPFDCHERIDRFRTRVETAHDLDKTHATRLSSALYKLDEYLREGELQMVTLTEHLAAVWAQAEACGIGGATPETLAPPIPRELAPGASKLAIRGLAPLDGGRLWQFLGWDAQGFGLCGQEGSKLVCRRIAIGEASPETVQGMTARGSWSSPRFILLESKDALWLLADLKLERLAIAANDVVSAHVGERGELRLVTKDKQKEWQLWSGAVGRAPMTTKVSELVAKLDPTLARYADDPRMLGGDLLLVGQGEQLVRVALAPDGTAKTLTQLDLTGPPAAGGSHLGTCRAGSLDAITMPSVIAFDTPKGVVKHARDNARCSASGVVWVDWGGCTPAGCTGYPEDVFRRDGGRNALYRYGVARDRVGQGDTIAWVGRLNAGLLVRGNAADLTTGAAVASGDELADRGESTITGPLNGGESPPQLGVYGGPNGGVVLYRNANGPQLGVAVDAAGNVSPLSVDWRETPLP